jgi:hypothetical protein
MRVQMVYQGHGAGNLPDNCGAFQSGETEDYCISIRISGASIENNESIALTMFPNPASGTVTIQSSTAEAVQINVVNLSGQMIASKTMNNGALTLDVQDISEGVYLVYALSTNGTVLSVEKLMVTR